MEDKLRTFQVGDLVKVRDANHVAIYSNNASVTSIFFDLRVTFSEMIPGPDDVPVIHERATVVMTWEHAKALSKLLQMKIANYETGNTIRSMRNETVDESPT